MANYPIGKSTDALKWYNDGTHTVALVHFTKSSATTIGMYDMLEHELCPWTIEYETLANSYHDNLRVALSFYNNTKQTPDKMKEEDVVIWVDFQSNPGFWYGRGDLKSGFITSGTEPYDENDCFILDSHPECRTTPEWVFDFITMMNVLSF